MCAKVTKMTPIHQAAAMHKPQIIRNFVSLGADVCSRDCFANSALDYAWTHPPSFHAIKFDEIQYVALKLANRRVMLSRNIRYELESLLSIREPLTTEIKCTRLEKLTVLANSNSFLYLSDAEKYQAIIHLYMELSFPADSADLQMNFHCNICDTSLNRLNICICSKCHDLYLCKDCHEG